MIRLKRQVFLASVTTSGPSPWYPCDYAFAEDQKRSIQIQLQNASDSIAVQVTNIPPTSSTDNNVLPVTTSTYTGTTAAQIAVLAGPVGWVRVLKTGENGPATVIGIV